MPSAEARVADGSRLPLRHLARHPRGRPSASRVGRSTAKCEQSTNSILSRPANAARKDSERRGTESGVTLRLLRPRRTQASGRMYDYRVSGRSSVLRCACRCQGLTGLRTDQAVPSSAAKVPTCAARWCATVRISRVCPPVRTPPDAWRIGWRSSRQRSRVGRWSSVRLSSAARRSVSCA